MKCSDCPYYYRTEEDDFCCCHYYLNDGDAPCEWEPQEQLNWEDYM